jgi:Domain of unknown function (DUF4430)
VRVGLAGALLFVVVLTGCGGGHRGGTATLWITHDRGAKVVLTAMVPAGVTAMQALAGKAKVTTRYGGRYVQSIDGSAGSLAARRDWFYFVNGIEADRGAADYRLHPGDVEWWDYRSWSRSPSVPVVVGAFPEPFLHGYGGKNRPAVVIGAGAGARALARLIHGQVAAAAPSGANVLRLASGRPRFTARRLGDGAVELVFAGDALRLARDPGSVRFRYSIP